jgi:hypothetical protein
MAIIPSFSPAHVPGGNDPDEVAADGEGHEQPPARVCLPKGVIPGFSAGVPLIHKDQERMIEEDLLAFCPGDLVTKPALVGVSFVPLETCACEEFVHDFVLVGSIQLVYTSRQGAQATPNGLEMSRLAAEGDGPSAEASFQGSAPSAQGQLHG